MALLQITNTTGAVTGSVDFPLALSTTDRMNAIGEMTFTCYVGSPGAASLAPGVYVKWTDGGYSFWGIVEAITRSGQDDGSEVLTVLCTDILRELAWQLAGLMKLGDANGVTTTVAAAMTRLLGTAGWTTTTTGDVGPLTIYLQADGASLFTMALSVAEKVGAWIVRTGGAARQTTTTATWTASGITARPVTGDKPANVAALQSLARHTSAADLVTEIVPFTAGNAAIRIGLEMATASLPAGFATFDVYWDLGGEQVRTLRHVAADAAYGRHQRFVQFPDISPISNSKPDVTAAANALQAAAVAWLTNQAKLTAAYTLSVDDSPAPIMPGQSLTVQAPELDATMYCTEATHTWTPGQPLRSTLKVTDGGLWPRDGFDAQVRSMEQSRVYRAHAQLAPNVYQLSYSKPVDAQYTADFPFRFDEGITQVLMAALDVKLGPLMSTVRAVGAGAVKTSAAPAHTHNLIMAAHAHTLNAHTHAYTTILAHTHAVPIQRQNSTPLGAVYFDVPPAPLLLKSFQGSGAGTTDNYPTTSTGTGSTANTGAPSTDATNGALVTDGTNSNYTTTATGAHDHTVDVSVTMEYGIYRDAAGNVYGAADLEYKINSGAWAPLTGATVLAGGWLRIPLTNALVDPVTFTPLALANTVSIRAAAISAATETFVVANSGAGQFNRWDDAGTYQQQLTGTPATALALSQNGWLYLLRKAAATIEVYAPNAAGTLALWDTWTLNGAGYNAICVDVRSGAKLWAGDNGWIMGTNQPLIVLGGSPALVALASFGGNIYAKSASTLYRINTNIFGNPTTNTPAAGTGLAARNDGRIVSTSITGAAFAIRVFESDLSAFVDCVRSDTGNAWTVGAVASAANLVHLGCSDGKVRTYILDLVAATATLAWTSPGTPGATGYPSNTNQLGVAAALSSKAATIDAQLTVRSVVQAIIMN